MARQLAVTDGPEAGRTFALENGQTLMIGRGQASDTRINDPRMSRAHCRVQVDGDKVLLFDNGSSSGTFVNGKTVDDYELQSGDVFQVGDTHIRYLLEGEIDHTTLVGNPIFGQPRPKPDVAPVRELVGQNLAHYRLDSLIAEGRSGAVFKGFDTKNETVAAVKVLTPDPTRSEEQKDRFVRAMQTMLPITHPHIVKLFAAGKNGPYCWAAMEYVDGESLNAVIDRLGIDGMLDWRDVYRVAVHIGRALDEAHQQKIIHRNLAPANILQRQQDKACLLGDLMLAKALEGALAQAKFTQPGQLVGDVPYMSPERTRDQASVDHRSDLYGLGATLYALLTGRPPFVDKSLPALIRQIREEQPRSPKEYQLSINDMFQDLVLRMMAKNPEDRFQTPSDLLRDLERIGKFNNLKTD